MPKRCRAPGCGRFIPEALDRCEGHPDPTSDHDLSVELNALRHVLHRLTNQDDIELQAKYIPRITSASIQAVRTLHQIGGRGNSDYLSFIGSIIEEVERVQDSTVTSGPHHTNGRSGGLASGD